MFSDCNELTEIDMSNFTNVTSYREVIISVKLNVLKISNIDVSAYQNSAFTYIISNGLSNTATVYVKDSNCQSALLGIKSTLNPVIYSEL